MSSKISSSVLWFIVIIIRSSAITDEEVDEHFHPDFDQEHFSTKCFGDLGCFYNGPPFYDPVARPVSKNPSDDTDAEFYLYTPYNPKKKYILEPSIESLKNSTFDSKYPLKIIIHGTGQKELTNFIAMKDALLDEGKYNVIVVNWTCCAGPSVFDAIGNGRLVAAMIAKQIKFLMNGTSLQSSDVHIIGHSLGAHIAGWVGERIENLGRISGVDPSGPNMHIAPPSVRLDTSDALFVDVLHANGGLNATEGLALIEPIGQVDFYPNGGQKQPGCHSDQSDENFAEFMSACSHIRAVQLYTATISSTECDYLAVQCSDWNKFEEGDCLPNKSNTNFMGFHARKYPGVPYNSKFYLKTSSEYPYCEPDSSKSDLEC